ncbi:MAG: polyprenyl synthetase family protein [Waddliaceae bacterium]
MLEELKKIRETVQSFILNDPYLEIVSSNYLKSAIKLYPQHCGKALRPALAIWSCSLFDETKKEHMIPIAAAIELTHVWSLVHDDIIDQDDTRRGGPSVHTFIQEKASSYKDAKKYGHDIAILAGDIQQAWVNYLITNANEIPAELRITILKRLNKTIIPELVDGESIDTEFEYISLSQIPFEKIFKMLKLKTAALLQFSTECGAMIGLNNPDINEKSVRSLSKYAEYIGLAFQLKDDLLGVFQSSEKLGKPAGSDIRNGKINCLFKRALEKMSEKEKQIFKSVYGKKDASEQQCQEVAGIIENCGAKQEVEELASCQIESALELLNKLPSNKYRNYLEELAFFSIRRKT